MRFEPRDYQRKIGDDLTQALANRLPTLVTSPTGSGKSVMWALLLEALPDFTLCVPTVEIAAGVYDKLTGHNVADLSEARIRRVTEDSRIVTSKRLLSQLQAGTRSCPLLGFDEAHHGADDTHQAILDLARPAYVGLTATPYRGTPAETAKLLAMYGNTVVTGLSLRDAVDRGVIALPTFDVVPLLDDETVDVVNGEFQVKGVERLVQSRVEGIVDEVRRFWSGGTFCEPITVVLGSVGALEIVRDALAAAELPTVSVVSGTRNRQQLFEQVIARAACLLQIRAVGEGVDLPLRIMIDASPTMSPVLWMQRVGRITRPWTGQPIYRTLCHNLMRHGYLYQGLIPRAQLAAARDVWGPSFKPSRRCMSRALGVSGFGRFEPTEVPLADGARVSLYCLRDKTGLNSYAALLVPDYPDPLYFHREDHYTGETQRKEVRPGVTVDVRLKRWGKWRRIAKMPELVGASSKPADPIGPNQMRFWRDAARSRCLDPDHEPDAKQFELLPILCDTGMNLWPR